MQKLLEIAINGSPFVKSLILTLLAIPITFAVQLIFYGLILLWRTLSGKNKEK